MQKWTIRVRPPVGPMWTVRVRRSEASVSYFADNGGDWWVATSLKTVRELEKLFREHRVGSVLYETIGQVAPTNLRHDGRRVLLIQVKRTRNQAGVDICLQELGIGLLEPAHRYVPEQTTDTGERSWRLTRRTR